MIRQGGNYKVKVATKYHKFKGTDGLGEHIKDMREPIIVQFDPDVDGCVAGVLICKYLRSIGKKFQWCINSNREHGLHPRMASIKDRDIITVDFVVTEEEVKSLVGRGNNIINLDHHVNGKNPIEVVTESGNYGIVINNQFDCEESDGRYLSGAGVVFETLVSIDEGFANKENRALVGLTLLSDVRDIENNLARGYLQDLYTYKYKGYIGYLIENTIGEKDYGFGVPRLDRNYVDFKFSPAINSCLRFNQEDMVVEFFLGSGFLDLGYHDLQKDLVKEIQENVEVHDFSNLRICIFKETDISVKYREVLSSFVGLVASRYLDGTHSVLCYMIAYKGGKPYVRRASFRGNINGLDYLKKIEKYVKGVGHGPAFGIRELVPSKKLFLTLNEVCKQVEGDSNYVKDVTEVINLSMFVNRQGFEYGEHNMYCLTKNRKFLRYSGRNIHTKRSGANYAEYLVDGVSVLCFDNAVDFDNGLILPINERGILCMYLEADSSKNIPVE